jgi:hypothetical protein
MVKIRNILVSCGAFWVSLWVAELIGWPFDKLSNQIVYGDSIFSAIALGIVISVPKSIAAALTGVIVTMVVVSRRSEPWALFAAVLYVVTDVPVRHHSVYPVNSWDRTWQIVDWVFPAVACIAAAFFTARLREKKNNAKQSPA